MRNVLKGKNSGVALVTVLVITAVTLALGYAALTISLSVLQGSKAAEHSVQARLNAESGLDAILVGIEKNLTDKTSEDNLGHHVYNPPLISNINDIQLTFEASDVISKEAGHFHFRVDGKGFLNSATYIVEASVRLGSTTPEQDNGGIGTPGFPISDAAIIANSSISFTGSAEVLGDIYAKGPINFSGGNVDIFGNVISTGSPSTVCGNPNTNTNSPSNYIGVVFHQSDRVHGDVYSSCDIKFVNWHSYVYGNGRANRGFVTTSGRPLSQHITEYDPLNPFTPSITSFDDPLDIDEFVELFSAIETNGKFNSNDWHIWEFTSLNSEVSVKRQGVLQNFIHETVNVFGVSRPVFAFDGFELNSQELVINGDVIIYSSQEVSFNNGRQITITPNSSLTIITPKGVKFKIAIYSESPEQLLVYSSTSKEIIGSDHQSFYVGIYAPKASVSINGSGEVWGVVYGKDVTVDGRGAVRFHPTLLSDMTTQPEYGSPNQIEVSRR